MPVSLCVCVCVCAWCGCIWYICKYVCEVHVCECDGSLCVSEVYRCGVSGHDINVYGCIRCAHSLCAWGREK